MKNKSTSISPDLRLSYSSKKVVGKAFVFLSICSVLLLVVSSVKHLWKMIFFDKSGEIDTLKHPNARHRFLFPYNSSLGFPSGWGFLRFGSPGPPSPKDSSRRFPGSKTALRVAELIHQRFLRQKILVDGYIANFKFPAPFASLSAAFNVNSIRSAAIENSGKPSKHQSTNFYKYFIMNLFTIAQPITFRNLRFLFSAVLLAGLPLSLVVAAPTLDANLTDVTANVSNRHTTSAVEENGGKETVSSAEAPRDHSKSSRKEGAAIRLEGSSVDAAIANAFWPFAADARPLTCPTSITIGFAPTVYCTNTQGVLNVNPVGGTFTNPTYQWSSSNGRATISNTTSATPDIDYITSGTVSISVTVTDACGTFTASQAITVSSTPEPTITISTTEVCQGNSINNVTGSPSGSTRQWMVNNFSVGNPFGTFSAPTNQTTNFTANHPGDAEMFYEVTTTAGCTGTSEAQPITIFSPVVATAAVQSGNQPNVCADATLTLAASATGGNGSYTYEWEYMGGTQVVPTFVNVSILLNNVNAQNPVLTPVGTASDGDTYIFRVKATDGITCNDFSDNITITVRKITSAALSITGASTICEAGTTTFKVDVTRGNSGGSPTYTLVYNDGTADITVNNYVSGSSITTNAQSADCSLSIVSIKDARVTVSNCSSPDNGSPSSVTVNNLTAGVVSADQTICSGDDVAAFTVGTAATGDGTLSYQWQISTDGGASWNDINGATGATYDEGTLTADAQYRRITTSMLNSVACTATSNVITVMVNNLTAGVVGADQTICAGDNVAAFTVATAATGDGMLSYQWQISTDGGAMWNDINAATAATYDEGTLTADAQYRRITTSTLNSVACTATSNVITVTVNNVTAGAIAGDQTICSNDNAAAFTEATASTGDGALSYQWQISTDGGAMWNNINLATAATYDEGALTADAQYRRITTSTLNSVACTATSNVITVTVNNITAGTIAGDQTICSSQTASFTQTSAAALDGTISYVWESSTDGGTIWNVAVPAGTAATYTTGALTATTEFRRKDISTQNMVECVAYTNVLTVTVQTSNTSGIWYVNTSTGNDTNLGTENCPKKTIQSAVTAAATGDVVIVAAGTYAENLTISKGLDIRGANYEVACGSRLSESVIAPSTGLPVSITADGVTLNGFEITAPSYQYAILCGNTSNLSISYNNIHHINSSATPALTTTHAIQYTVPNAPAEKSDVSVTDNCINNIGSVNLTGNSATAMGFLQSTTTGTLTSLNIARNTISNVTVSNAAWPTGKIAYGIQLNAGSANYKTTTGKIVNATINDNVISELSGHIATGIALEGNTENAAVTGNAVSNLTSTKNTNRAGGGVDLNGLKFESNRFVSTCLVENNSFATNTFNSALGNGVGYGIANYVPTVDGGTATATCNWFGTTIANVIADNAGLTGKILNKENCSTTFQPFYLVSGTDAGAAIGFQPTAGMCTGSVVEITSTANNIYCGEVDGSITVTINGGTAPYTVNWTGGSDISNGGSYTIIDLAAGTYGITVTDANGSTDSDGGLLIQNLPVHNSTADTRHATIQAAINAAVNNDVIEVCAGTYTENVLITKTLDIRGANYGISASTETLRATRNAETIVNGAFSIGNVSNVANNVTIDGFKFIGSSVTFTDRTKIAVIKGLNAKIQNNIFDSELAPSTNYQVSGQSTFGITTGSGYDQTGLEVKDNYFVRLRSGVFSNPSLSTAQLYANNQFSSRTGINFDHFGSAAYFATVSNNNFVEVTIGSDIIGPVTAINCTALLSGSNMQFTGNTITSNYVGLDFKDIRSGATVNVSNNFFTKRPSAGGVTYHLWVRLLTGSSGVTVSNNSFTEMGSGRAIQNDGTGSINAATCNWYGTLNSNTIASKVFGNVTYSPWLVDGTDDQPSTVGFQPAAGTCTGTPVVITATKTADAICDAGAKISVTFSGGTAPYDIAWTGGSATGVSSPYVITGLTSGTYTATVTDANSSTAASAAVVIATFPVGNVNTGVGYNDIPAAISAASAGDTLKVCAGTFTVPTNSTFNVNKSLTLRGANYQVDPTVTPSVRGAESTIVVNHSSGMAMTISASNVSVDGFDFEVKGARDAINVKTTLVAGGSAALTNMNFSNNIFRSSTTSTSQKNGVVFGENSLNSNPSGTLDTASMSNVVIDRNLFDFTTFNNSSRGVVMTTQFDWHSYTNFDITNNRFKMGTVNSTGVAGTAVPNRHQCADFTITDNNFTGYQGLDLTKLVTPAIENNMFSGLVYRAMGIGSTNGGAIRNITIDGTGAGLLSGGQYYAYGIDLYGGTDFGTPANGPTGNNSNLTVEQNVISNFTHLTEMNQNFRAINVRNNAGTGLVISNNTIDNVQNGVLFAATTTNAQTVTGNSITNATTAIRNLSAGVTIGAECNWYGSVNANTIASKLFGAVDYSPYLIVGTDDDGLTLGFQPAPNTCTGTPVEISSTVITDEICGVTGSVELAFTGGAAPFDIAWTGGSSVGVISPFNIGALTAGTYTITVTDANGSTATAEATVQYLPVHNTTADTYYATIQAAITAATNGDAIQICEGTYTESITVNKQLDISGQGVGTIIQNPSGTVFTYTAAGSGADAMDRAYLRDVKVSGSTKGLYVQELVNHLSLEGVNFDNNSSYAIHVNNTSGTMEDWAITNGTFNANSAGLYVSTAANIDGVSITGSTFTNQTNTAIYAGQSSGTPGGFSNVTITGNTLTNNGPANNQAAFYLEKLSNAVISGNTMTNNGLNTNPRGIIVNLKYGAYSNVSITDNTIVENRGGLQTNGYGVNVQGRNDEPSYNSNPGSLNDVAVTGNEISGIRTGIEIDNDVNWNFTTIENNKVSGAEYGVLGVVYGTGNTANATTTMNVHENSILANTSVVANANPNGGTIDAECNWYGTINGSTIASKISGTVDYSPWLVDGTDDDLLTIGFQPVTGACSATAVEVMLTSQTNILGCFGDATGAIEINISGGVPPYSYDWNGTPTGDGTTTITGLTAGTYTVTVTDGIETTGTLSVTLTQPDAVTPIGTPDHVSCRGGNNGSIELMVTGGTGSYNFDWNGSPAGDDSSVITDLEAGTYTVTVTDANNCTGTTSVTVNEPASAVSASISGSTNVSCNGGSNGAATVTAAGGTLGYSYTWSNGQTDATAINLTAGTYTVTITDSNNCEATADVIISEPAALMASITAQTNVSCYGGYNGSATVTAVGGTMPYDYDWAFAYGATITDLSAAIYTVSVTDAQGCMTTAVATITQPDALSLMTSQTNVTCNGGTNGTATVTPSGGTTPYTYAWSNAQTDATATDLVAGTYTVTVTDANGCAGTTSVSITQPAVLAIATSPTSATATVACGTTTAVDAEFVAWNTDVTYTGGAAPITVTENYTVTTDVNGALVETYNGTEPTAPSADGGYTVVTWTVTDDCGNTATVSATFTVNNCMRISGALKYYRDDAGVGGVNVDMVGTGANDGISAGDGSYTVYSNTTGNFDVIPASIRVCEPCTTGTAVSTADLKNIYNISVEDVDAIKAHIAAGAQFDNIYQRAAANVVLGSSGSQTNNRLTSADATALSQAINGSLTQQVRLSRRAVPHDEDLIDGAPDPLPRSWGLVPVANAGGQAPAQYGDFTQKRNYPTLDGAFIDQDFVVLQVGDVTDHNSLRGEDADARYAGLPLIWKLKDAELTEGEVINAEFRIEQMQNLRGWQFGLQFDPEYLKVDTLTTTNALPLDPEVDFGLYQAEMGEIRSLWTDGVTKSLNKGESVFTLRFTALQGGKNLSEVLKLEEGSATYALTDQRDHVAVMMAFEGLVQPNQSPVLHQNTPNPFDKETSVRFELPEASDIQLTIHDVNGRLINELNGYYSQGLHEVRFERGEFGQYAGVLYYTLRSGDFIATRKMVIID